jgi:hypothetical protein
MSVKSFKTSGVGVDLAPKGLVLINTTSFSGVAAQSFNDVFSATYDNYRIIITEALCSTATSDVRLRLRVGGSDNSTASSYVRRGFYADVSSLQNSPAAEDSQNLVMFLSTTAGQTGFSVIDMLSPFTTERTGYGITSFSGAALASANVIGNHNQSVSYDGFTLFTNTGNNFTAKISIYGYNK